MWVTQVILMKEKWAPCCRASGLSVLLFESLFIFLPLAKAGIWGIPSIVLHSAVGLIVESQWDNHTAESHAVEIWTFVCPRNHSVESYANGLDVSLGFVYVCVCEKTGACFPRQGEWVRARGKWKPLHDKHPLLQS